MKTLATISLCIGFSWLNIAATPKPPQQAVPAASISFNNYVFDEVSFLYESMNLEHLGLSRQAFEYAYQGYNALVQQKRLKAGGHLAICDFSQSSKKKRLYIVDMSTKEVVLNTYVAHGKKSGGEFATRFSNKPGSHQSSLGFYITNNTYFGEHGLSLRMTGVEKGINDKAMPRNIVVHGANYIEESRLKQLGNMGRSYGCPAVPSKQSKQIINLLSNGQCLFIYHPSKKYLNESKIIND